MKIMINTSLDFKTTDSFPFADTPLYCSIIRYSGFYSLILKNDAKLSLLKRS